MIAQFGDEVIERLLEAYRDRLETDDAIERSCGVTVSEFESGFRLFVGQQVRQTTMEPAAEWMSFSKLNFLSALD